VYRPDPSSALTPSTDPPNTVPTAAAPAAPAIPRKKSRRESLSDITFPPLFLEIKDLYMVTYSSNYTVETKWQVKKRLSIFLSLFSEKSGITTILSVYKRSIYL
jgi:hypothetical protein